MRSFCYSLTALLALLGLLGLGVMTFVEPSQHTIENRPLAKQPRWPETAEQWAAWPDAIETWWADAVHRRPQWMGVFNGLRLKLGISPQTGVTVGKDGWLFVNLEGANDDFRNRQPLSEDQLQRWRDYLLFRHRDAERRGAVFVFLITPNAQSIYGEYMPDHIRPLSTVSRIDQMVALGRETGVRVLDLRPALRAAKPEGLLYNKTDSHWNMRGANVAQYELARLLQADFPQLQPRRYDMDADFIETTDRDLFQQAGAIYYAGLSYSLGLVERLSEPQPLLRGLPRPCQRPRALDYGPWSRLSDDSRSRFAHAVTCDSGHYKALLFRDSFTELLTPYLNGLFAQTTYVWPPRPVGGNMWAFFMDQMQPDIVIEQIVERYLRHVPEPRLHYPGPQPNQSEPARAR